MPDLRTHFAQTLALAGAKDPDGAVWNGLERRHGEPHRHFHTLAQAGFRLGLLATTAHDTPALRLAHYYLRIIHEPCGETNEIRSARFARDQLGSIGVTEQLSATVYDLIRSLDPLPSPPGEEADLMHDIDRGILGAAPTEYEAHAAALRREESWLPEGKYRRARLSHLMNLLERPAIYRTPDFQQRFESTARANLAAEILRLRG